MRNFSTVVMLLCAAIGATDAVHAALTPQQTAEVHTHIAQFSDRRFTVRQEAVAKLVKMGPDVLPIVLRTFHATTDREIKLRCDMTLRGISKKYGIKIDRRNPLLRGTIDFKCSRITLDEQDEPIAMLLEEFAEQSGNTSPVLSRWHQKGSISLKVIGMPYWQAMDAFCRTAGMVYASGWGTETLRLSPSKHTNAPSVYVGPIVVKLTSASRTDTHALRFQTEPPSQRTRQLSYGMTAYVEDRLPIVTSDGWLTGVVTVDGRNLIPKGKDGKTPPRTGSLRNTYSSRFSGTLSVALANVPDDVGDRVTLNGVIELEAVTGVRTLPVAFAAKNVPVTADGVSLTLRSVAEGGNAVTVTLAMKSDSRLPNLLCHHKDLGYGFSLRAPDGRQYTTINTYRWTGKKSYSGKPGAPGYRLDRTRGTPIDGTLTLTFPKVPRTDDTWSLVYTRPTTAVKQAFPFTLRDVPVP